ncbi:MAG TPA: hypothetical protein VIJ94_12220, partial [Caulobacteraceae bacterium]
LVDGGGPQARQLGRNRTAGKPCRGAEEHGPAPSMQNSRSCRFLRQLTARGSEPDWSYAMIGL